MGRPAIKDLEPFHKWLMEERNVHLTTAKCYVSNVRTIRKELGAGAIDQTVIDGYFTSLYNHRPGSFANFRTAWRNYVDWAKETLDIELPPVTNMTRVKQTATKTHAPLRDEVCQATMQLSTIMSFSDVSNLTWGKVPLQELLRGVEPLIRVRHHTEPNDVWLVPREALEALIVNAEPDWPEVLPPAELPLVPSTPRSLDPCPRRVLAYESQKYERTRLDSLSGNSLGD